MVDSLSVIEHWLCTAPNGNEIVIRSEEPLAAIKNAPDWKVEGPFVPAEQLQGAVKAERERINAQVLEMAAKVPRDSPEFGTLLSVASRIRQGGQ